MKLKAIIIDGEPLAHDIICEYLEDVPFIEVVEQFHRATQALHFLTEQAVKLETQVATVNTEEQSHIFIKVDKKLLQIELANITYLEAYGNYVKIWLGDQCVLTPRTLTSFEQQLDGHCFYRINKSFVIQKQHIQYIEDSTVVMNNKAILPLGKNYRHLSKAFK